MSDLSDVERLGIARSYIDQEGVERHAPDATLASLRAALAGARDTEPGDATMWLEVGEGVGIGPGHALVTEDGAEIEGPASVPVEAGYHRYFDDGGASRLVIVSPSRCHLPSDLRSWGWAVQLYALRSKNSWGIGDLGSLSTLARDAGAEDGYVLLNPLHAPPPGKPRETSPYFPGSRCFFDPLYLDVEELPQLADTVELSELSSRAGALNAEDRIDRDAVAELKEAALTRAWERAKGGEVTPIADNPLTRFATFCALTEVHGSSWRAWPPEFQHPDDPSVTRFRAEHPDRVAFHCWVQSLLAEQIEAASEANNLIFDLAVGIAPDGADAWLWQDALVTGATVGAPPDDYNRDGQNWSVLGFNPRGLAATGYEAFIATLRASMRFGAGLRIDHVMSLFRLFMIPEGVPAAEGTYVRYPAERLLDILALESSREGCFVIGEDLGTVEDVVRRTMGERQMLSYKLMWFEDSDPVDFPSDAMAAVNTHDLPTIAGLWSGADSDQQRALGLDPNDDFKDRIVARISDRLGVGREAPVDEVIDRSYRALAAAPCRLVMGALEDVLEVTQRHNQPGTTGPWNWSHALPQPLEDLLAHPRKSELQAVLSTRVDHE